MLGCSLPVIFFEGKQTVSDASLCDVVAGLYLVMDRPDGMHSYEGPFVTRHDGFDLVSLEILASVYRQPQLKSYPCLSLLIDYFFFMPLNFRYHLTGKRFRASTGRKILSATISLSGRTVNTRSLKPGAMSAERATENVVIVGIKSFTSMLPPVRTLFFDIT